MISSKNMNSSKMLSAFLEIFTPPSTQFFCKVGLFTGTLPNVIAVPDTTNQAHQLTPTQLFVALGITSSQFLGCQNYSTTAGRKPNVTIGRNADYTVNRKLNVNFTPVTTDLVGMASGTPTFFIGLRTSAAGTDASSWAAMISGSYVDEFIIGTVGNEDSDADLKLVGGSVVGGQGYRFTDLNLQY